MKQNQEVEQLWYMWSNIGYGVTTGFRVRAASPGLRDIQGERYRAFDPYLRYTLPTGVNAYTLAVDKAPVSLALLDTSQGRILLQRVYTGKDLIGRAGAFFCHLLTDLPDDFTAREAISLWRNTNLLQERDTLKSNSLELSAIPYAHLSGYVAHPHTYPFQQLDKASAYKYLPMVLMFFFQQAFKQFRGQGHLYIAAPPAIVAGLIAGLTQCFPGGLLKRLTFSTYEDSIANAPSMIIGTCMLSPNGDAPTNPQDLPDFCYQGENQAIHFYTEKCSAFTLLLPPEIPNSDMYRQLVASYVQFATKSVIDGDQSKLMEILATAERLSIEDVDKFLALYLFSVTPVEQLSPEHVVMLFQQLPELAAELLMQPAFEETMITLSVRNRVWWESYGKDIFSDFSKQARQHMRMTSALASFIQHVVNTTPIPLPGSDTLFPYYLTLLSTLAYPASASQCWLDLKQRLSKNDAHRYSWTTRSLLLQYWSFLTPPIPATQMSSWLNLTWEELAALQSQPLPQEWLTEAFSRLLAASSTSFPLSARSVFEGNLPIFEKALCACLSGPQWRAATSFFAWLVTQGYQRKIDLLYSLFDCAMQKRESIDQLLQAAQLTWEETVEVLDRTAPTLLTLPKIPQYFTYLIGVYISNVTAQQLQWRTAQQLLHHISHSTTLALPHEQRTLLPTLTTLAEFLANPYIWPDRLVVMATAYSALPANRKEEAKETILIALASQIKEDKDLYNMLVTMVPSFAPSNTGFMLRLAETLSRQQCSPERKALCIWRGIAEAISSNGKNSAHYAEQLLDTLLSNETRETFDHIDKEAREQQWRKDIFAIWDAYNKRKRPQRVLERGFQGAQGIMQGAQLIYVVPKARAALKSKEVWRMADAYHPSLHESDKFSPDEVNALKAAAAFKRAYAEQRDEDLIANQALLHAFDTDLEYEPEVIKRYQYVRERMQKVQQFRAALQSRRVENIARAFDSEVEKSNSLSESERERGKLARDFIDALDKSNPIAFAQAYQRIQASSHHTAFGYTKAEQQWIESIPQDRTRQGEAAHLASSPGTVQHHSQRTSLQSPEKPSSSQRMQITVSPTAFAPQAGTLTREKALTLYKAYLRYTVSYYQEQAKSPGMSQSDRGHSLEKAEKHRTILKQSDKKIAEGLDKILQEADAIKQALGASSSKKNERYIEIEQTLQRYVAGNYQKFVVHVQFNQPEVDLSGISEEDIKGFLYAYACYVLPDDTKKDVKKGKFGR